MTRYPTSACEFRWASLSQFEVVINNGVNKHMHISCAWFAKYVVVTSILAELVVHNVYGFKLGCVWL